MFPIKEGNSLYKLTAKHQFLLHEEIVACERWEICNEIHSDLISFHHQGFNVWAASVMELLDDTKLGITMKTKSFSLRCKRAFQKYVIAVWNNNLQDSHTRTFTHLSV